MITHVLDLLRCPVCAQRFFKEALDSSIVCDAGHSFDVARQGFVTLLRTQRQTGQDGDTAAMVENRITYLETGRYDRIAGAVSDKLLANATNKVSSFSIADLGAGPGYYASFVMRQAEARSIPARIIALDNSLYAARRSAKLDPNIGSVRSDTWDELPILDGCLDAVMIIFAPRNMDEIARVLRPGGTMIVVTPLPGHLKTLRGAVSMLSVPASKREQVRDEAASKFELISTDEIIYSHNLSIDQAASVILMGPSALHVDAAQLRHRLADQTSWTLDVAVTVSEYRLL